MISFIFDYIVIKIIFTNLDWLLTGYKSKRHIYLYIYLILTSFQARQWLSNWEKLKDLWNTKVAMLKQVTKCDTVKLSSWYFCSPLKTVSLEWWIEVFLIRFLSCKLRRCEKDLEIGRHFLTYCSLLVVWVVHKWHNDFELRSNVRTIWSFK